jgi:hypothetical protein
MGDVVSFDWNLGYSPAWAVTRINGLFLHFRRPAYATHGNLEHPLSLVTPLPIQPSLPGPNGVFHFELKVNQRERQHPSGEYHIVSADAHPVIAPDYAGPALEPSNSPAAATLCIRFENTSPLAPPATE